MQHNFGLLAQPPIFKHHVVNWEPPSNPTCRRADLHHAEMRCSSSSLRIHRQQSLRFTSRTPPSVAAAVSAKAPSLLHSTRPTLSLSRFPFRGFFDLISADDDDEYETAAVDIKAAEGEIRSPLEKEKHRRGISHTKSWESLSLSWKRQK